MLEMHDRCIILLMLRTVLNLTELLDSLLEGVSVRGLLKRSLRELF